MRLAAHLLISLREEQVEPTNSLFYCIKPSYSTS